MSSTNSFIDPQRARAVPYKLRFKLVLLILFSGFEFSGCAGIHPAQTADVRIPSPKMAGPVAVMPVYNISGTPARNARLLKTMKENLDRQGWNILPGEVVESFIDENRIRYVGGIDESTAAGIHEATGAQAVLITSLILFNETPPPRVAMSSRLVSTAKGLNILWMEGIGRAGNDDPGILQFRLIEDPDKLTEKVVGHLADSLSEGFEDPSSVRTIKGKTFIRKYPPRSIFKSPVLLPDKKYRVAVIPFYNSSERKYAGEILALQFIEHIRRTRNLEPVEPGVIRHALLGLRVMMEDGISLANTDILFHRLDVDLIVTGRVLDYRDFPGQQGFPVVDFSTLVIERKSREVVWASKSSNTGLDNVDVFEWGKENTAFSLASTMVRNIVRLVVSDISWWGNPDVSG